MYCVKCGRKLEENKLCQNCNVVNSQENVTVNPIQTNINGREQKSKIAAGLFGIFLGFFGAHNFYLGYTAKAVAQLLLTILSCGFLAPIIGIWGLIEGILIMTSTTCRDADGILLRN